MMITRIINLRGRGYFLCNKKYCVWLNRSQQTPCGYDVTSNPYLNTKRQGYSLLSKQGLAVLHTIHTMVRLGTISDLFSTGLARLSSFYELNFPNFFSNFVSNIRGRLVVNGILFLRLYDMKIVITKS